MKIGAYELKLPLIQGGMGIGISLSGLAGAVAAEGGMGVISAINPGYREEDFTNDSLQANIRALANEIRKAREKARGRGLIGVNVMCAISQFKDMVVTAARAGANALICGAGLPLSLPELVPDPSVLLAPIVSGQRAARILFDKWVRSYRRFPDFLVLEGPLAGGHLGFKREQIEREDQSLEQLLRQLIPWRDEMERVHSISLPVFAAGGIRDAKDVERVMSLGANGIQVGTPFIATHECDAAEELKRYLIRSGEADVRIIRSPVGMPGRALASPLLEKVASEGRVAPEQCARCLKNCHPAETPYCINAALQAAVKGDTERGLFFSGAKIEGLDRIISVKERIGQFFPGRMS